MRTRKLRTRVAVSAAIIVLVAIAITILPTAALARWGSPQITGVTPSPAEIGDIITLTSAGGENGFCDTPGTVKFKCGDATGATYTEGRIVSWSNDRIEVIVPYNAAGSGILVDTSDGYQCDSIDFYVKLTLDSIFPGNVKLGQTVTLRGGPFNCTDPHGDIHFFSQSTGDFVLRYPDITYDRPMTNNEIEVRLYNVVPGAYDVYYKTYAGVEQESQRLPLTIVGDAVLTGASPNPCPAGATLTIEGSNFGDVRAPDEDVWFEDESGNRFEAPGYPIWQPEGTIKVNTLPNFDGDFHIVVSRGISSPQKQAAQSSNEIEVTFTQDPIPPQDQVNPTSRTWAHDSIGIPSPAKNWYLAEGSTANGDETWVLVQNPNNTPASVTLTYITSNDTIEMPADTIAANSRKTYNAGEVYPETAGVSVEVASDSPVVAEKAMYGNNRTWACDSIGASQTATQWYLAEGCTAPGYEARVSVMNPGDSAANVTLTYMTSAGSIPGPSETLPANSRKSYDVAATVPLEWEVSTEVTSNVPVVAERAMFGNSRTWAHDSIGVTSPSTAWYLAEGCTATDFETWVLVQNPNDAAATVTLTYMTPSGAVPGPTETLNPNSRRTFEVAQSVPGAWEVSTRVTSDQPVVVERALYGNSRTWAHDSIGVSNPTDTWYLAEGCTLGGMETWILVQNPNDTDAQITITYNTTAGAVAGASETVPANSRKTYNPAYVVNNCADVSTKVVSNTNVVVERAMYGNPK